MINQTLPAENAELESSNLAAFARHLPALHARLTADSLASSLVFDDAGVPNVQVAGAPFYREAPAAFASRQLAEFWNDGP